MQNEKNRINKTSINEHRLVCWGIGKIGDIMAVFCTNIIDFIYKKSIIKKSIIVVVDAFIDYIR